MTDVQFPDAFGRAAHILGGEETIGSTVTNAFEAHKAMMNGMPIGTLLHLVDRVEVLNEDDTLQNALGMSRRTLQRLKAKDTSEPLGRAHSERVWTFAKIFGRAVDVFGSNEDAENWMKKPAIGLSNLRPFDLLATAAGTQAVEDYLTRIEFGVYT